MWLHHDIGWWGFVLAVVTLILAYPLDVLAHLSAPKVRDWWAKRSVASTQARIEKLENQLSEYEAKYQLLTEVEDEIIQGIVGLGTLGTLCIEFLVVCFLLAFLRFSPQPPDIHYAGPAAAFSALIAGLGYAVSLWTFGRLTAFRKRRSPSERNALKTSIEELKKRLAKRTNKS